MTRAKNETCRLCGKKRGQMRWGAGQGAHQLCMDRKQTAAATTTEIRDAALRGGGITKTGLAAARRLWSVLLPEMEELEREWAATGRAGHSVEGEIGSFVRVILEGVLARKRYAASIRAKKAKKAEKARQGAG